MRVSSPYTGRHSLLISIGTDSAPSGPSWTFLWPLPRSGGPSLPGAPTSQRGPPAADSGPPALRPAHPCQRLGDCGPASWPGLFTRPARGGGLTTQPPLPGAQTRPGLHSPQQRAPADRQSRRRARSSRSSDERRRTTTPRSPRARPGALWEAPPRCCGNAEDWSGAGGFWWSGAPSSGGAVVDVWGC